jgi:pimeloyl-ACP methyl ester carboxylesterase
VPHDVVDRWLAPAQRDRAIRRDLRKYSLSPFTKDELRAWSESLRGFDRPALIVWGSEDRVMPPEHGRRLAELLPQGTLVEIPDSYTLIPEDQPAAFAKAMREFVPTAHRTRG